MNNYSLIGHATNVILPFWDSALDEKEGGFFAFLDHEGRVKDVNAKKGLVQHARHLWTFAYAFEQLLDKKYLTMATHAYDFLVKNFWDGEKQGFYYYVSRGGKALDDRKHMYPHAFVLYGLSQYYKVAKSEEVLNWCHKVFGLITKHAYEQNHGGYHECFSRNWEKISQIDEYGVNGQCKTMNSHIHLLEAVTLYAEICPRPEVIFHLNHLIDIIVDKVYDKNDKTLRLYFDRDWNKHEARFSFGHDIETSWLLAKALTISQHRVQYVTQVMDELVAQVYQNGRSVEGYIHNEYYPETGKMDERTYWWIQVEGMVGFLYAALRQDRKEYFDVSNNLWKYCLAHYWNPETLEWHALPDDFKSDKSSLWKTSYHTIRAIFICNEKLKGYL